LEESALLTGQEPDIEGSIDMIRAALLGVAVALVQTAEVQARVFEARDIHGIAKIAKPTGSKL
jgi:hypothetical protein